MPPDLDKLIEETSSPGDEIDPPNPSTPSQTGPEAAETVESAEVEGGKAEEAQADVGQEERVKQQSDTKGKNLFAH